MDSSWPTIAACVIGGVVLAFFYFGTLWWGVRRLPELSRPELWFLLSTLVRMLTLVACIYLLMGGRWERALAVMLGFTIGRYLVFRHLDVWGSRSAPR